MQKKQRFECGLLAGGIIGQQTKKKMKKKIVTVNNDRYCVVTTDYLMSEIVDREFGDSWFQ